MVGVALVHPTERLIGVHGADQIEGASVQCIRPLFYAIAWLGRP